MGLIIRSWKKSGGAQQLEAEPATSGDIVEALKPLILLPDNEVSFPFCHPSLPLLINTQRSSFSLADGLVIRGERRQEAATHLPGKSSPLGQTLWVRESGGRRGGTDTAQKVQAPVPLCAGRRQHLTERRWPGTQLSCIQVAWGM